MSLAMGITCTVQYKCCGDRTGEKNCSMKEKSIWATILLVYMWSRFLLDISAMFLSHTSDLIMINKRREYISLSTT